MRRKGTMTDHSINSEFLNEKIPFKIYKPEVFSPLYKYHVAIMQDGNDYFQLGRMATISDDLHSQRRIDRTIFVGIPYQDKYDRSKKYHPNGEHNESYIRFLVHEMVPFLDDLLPTYQMGHGRILIGDSLGGTVSLMAACRYAHTFGKVIMQSPYVDEKVMDAVNHAPLLQQVDIYHTIGIAEESVTTTDGKTLDFLSANRELNQILTKKKLSYTYHELEGDHNWGTWQKDLPNALLTLLGKSEQEG
ncbi:alpha/beta hydrolase-fold protein [Bacillaceae bacterium S4-13-56]